MSGMQPRPGLPRSVEIVLAAGALIALSPLLLAIAIAVRLDSKGPALFRQQRVGQGGRPFELIKFRTMRTAAAGSRVTASGDRRITSIGRLLRASKLDELPELFNILRGEMSFVGPRPEVPAFVDLEDERWRFVLTARPGLTDPVTLRLRDEEQLLESLAARAAGRAADTEELYRRFLQPFKLRGYAAYLKQRSAFKDLGVLVATKLAVINPSRAKAPSIEELLEEMPGERPEETPDA